MTDAKLDDLKRMQVCLKGLMDVRIALNNNNVVEIRSRDSTACLNISTHPAFEQAFDEFISTQLCRLKKAFDEA